MRVLRRSCEKAAFFVRASLLLLLPLYAGCLVDFPTVRATGDTAGGHPKLRAALRFISEQRKTNARTEAGVVSAQYTLSVTPTPQSSLHRGTLPSREGLAHASYGILP